MGRIRARITTVWVGGLAVTAIVAGCGGSSPPEQSGMQRLAGRDFDNLFFWNQQTAAFTRQTTAPGGANQDLWVWPDGENTPLLALSQIDWSPPSWSARIVAGDILMTGPYAEQVYDLQARASLDLEMVIAQGTSGGAGIEWASVRRDGGLILAGADLGPVLAGRASAFTFLPLPYVAWSADFMGDDLAVVASPSSSELYTQLIYRMALPSGDVSPLPVAPLNNTLQRCAPFSIPPCRTIRVVGCGAGDAVCPDTGRAPCAILYVRADAKTGVLQPYIFDVNTGQETALPGIDPTDFVLSPDRHSAAWTHAVGGDTTTGNVPPEATPIYVHNFCSGAAAQCTLASPKQLAWRADGGELVVDLSDNQVGLVDVLTGNCSALGFGPIDQHAFSPAGDRLAWTASELSSNFSGDALWVGDAAGGGPRIVANDVVGFTFSPDGQALYIIRASGDQFSLSWLSPAADSPTEQLIADAYSGGTLRGNQRVLLIDHWNTQDGSGNLELVDLRSGTRQVLAQAVTDLTGSSSADGAARVMYSVRGRFASGQDGLWETTLPAP